MLFFVNEPILLLFELIVQVLFINAQYHCIIIIKTNIMKTTMKLFTYVLIILSLTITSCAKDGEDGAVGPAGTQGETGSEEVV